ncbi:MAG: hypothetical protein HQM15_10340 [Deltaproteobacteria bacterium]|nr:hypothetical protein [Deltaproteobacteria bacterium]
MRLIFLTTTLVCLFATHLSAQQKNFTLSDLASSPAVITKLDWLMIKAEVRVMRDEQSVSDVGWPTYYYDKAENSLSASAFVNPKWWEHADTKTAKEELNSRGTLYYSTMFYSDSQLLPLIKNKATGCQVRFFTWGKSPNPIVLATYLADKGELILK